jgi:hexulose-6-phosphate isomerase
MSDSLRNPSSAARRIDTARRGLDHAPASFEACMPNHPDRRSFLRGAMAGAALLPALSPAHSSDRSSPSRAQDPAPATPPKAGPAPADASAPPLRLKKAVKYAMIAPEGSIEERFALVKSLGFDGVEIDSPLDIDRAAVVAASRKTGIVVHGVIDSVHWKTRFSDPDEAVRAKAVEALLTAIDDAHTYGASTVLVVPGRVADPRTENGGRSENREQVWSRSQESIAKALPRAKEKGITIAIEVVWNDFITTPADFVLYVDGFADPRVAAYFDCSNVVKFGVPPADWIRALGKRMVKLDFKGYSRAKSWVKIGDGDEDWPAIRAALREVGYSGWATAEVEAGGREHLADVKRRMDAVLGA